MPICTAAESGTIFVSISVSVGPTAPMGGSLGVGGGGGSGSGDETSTFNTVSFPTCTGVQNIFFSF
jgi:hypothetical protein